MAFKNNQTLIPVARLLLDAFRAFESDLAQNLASKGFTNVTTSNFNVLRHLNPEGMHLSDLARDAQISKQAIGKMVKDLEKKGYVELIPDVNDARAKFVRHTAKGKTLIKFAISVVTDMEMSYQSLLGKKEYNNLRQSVSKVLNWHLNSKE